MATVGRNQPCPCGSGKRYKECHGAIELPSAASGPAVADRSWLPQVMHAALRAQKSGRLREAAEGYRRALAAQPTNFDATHMLALVEYEQGEAQGALALLRQAIELRTRYPLARHNLRVLEAMPLIEEEIGREVLPRLLERVQPVTDVVSFMAPGSPVHVVIADDLDDPLRGMLDPLVASARVREACAVGRGRLAEGGYHGRGASTSAGGFTRKAAMSFSSGPRARRSRGWSPAAPRSWCSS